MSRTRSRKSSASLLEELVERLADKPPLPIDDFDLTGFPYQRKMRHPRCYATQRTRSKQSTCLKFYEYIYQDWPGLSQGSRCPPCPRTLPQHVVKDLRLVIESHNFGDFSMRVSVSMLKAKWGFAAALQPKRKTLATLTKRRPYHREP